MRSGIGPGGPSLSALTSMSQEYQLGAMKEMQAQLDLLRAQIAECERLQIVTKNQTKRDLYARLLMRYRAIANELEHAIANLPSPFDTLLRRKPQEPLPKRGGLPPRTTDKSP
ncbi:hypothetical protein SG09_32050 [Bradyrhizobium ottawaense]|nr:hypothetical protein SG09_32050 [Bradyrhizobium ottawaense]GMO13399.1 hypothetical protein BwSH14_00040 [Bradyrhizobium ottawaense]GMO49164.1 hypothetical protein BwSF12_57590 [Bradyrhizobium ottawaense]GMO65052.1 hypothetical protein BwSG10_16890 [Bradyrhizobium ottawaense]GMO69485.1 hypothetical protein BwSH17_24980 [Bradyrhizobium ottawaense]